MLASWLELPGAADRIATWSQSSGLDLARLGTTATAEEITDTSVTQPLVVAATLLAWEELGERGLLAGRDFIAAGHSVGEIAAYAIAGVISTDDAVALAATRGAEMAKACAAEATGMSAVLGGDEAEVLARLDELAARGVELRLLHAELPSRPFRERLAHHPRLIGGGLALRRCPRVHLKAVIVDGELLYLGSANWTGAGLGAKGSGRRNFELGFGGSDDGLLDRVQELYDRVWRGSACKGCKLRDVCPSPLDGRRT